MSNIISFFMAKKTAAPVDISTVTASSICSNCGDSGLECNECGAGKDVVV
jgi:hypothetical protein